MVEKFFNTRPNSYPHIRRRLVSDGSRCGGKGDEVALVTENALQLDFIGKRTGSLRSAGC